MTLSNALTVLATSLGHLILLICAVNVLHGLGIRLKAWLMDLGSLALLGVAGFGMLAIAWLGFRAEPQEWPTWLQGYRLLCLTIALGIFPVVTIRRQFRRPPAGTSEFVTLERDLLAELGADALIGDAPLSWLFRLPGNESLKFRIVHAELRLPGLPREFDGLTILHLSDFHFTRRYRRLFFDNVIDELADQSFDLVVFTGDLIDDNATLEWIGPVFGRLKGRLGQFSILGNHDYSHHPEQVCQTLEAAGFHDIEGVWTNLTHNGRILALGGTSSPWGPTLDLDAADPSADYRIVLSHSPDQFPRLARHGVGLVLSGHNHGGQVRLPFIGPILMPSRYSRRFDRGPFAQQNARLYVSQGLGGKHPIRYRCRPEVTRLTLRSVGK